MPFSHAYHGGRCCGIEHIFGFNNRSNTELLVEDLRALQEMSGGREDGRIIFRGEESYRLGNLCLEVTVTDKQLQRVGEALKTAGFKRVARFPNPNSQNHVNIFYWHPDLETFN